MSYAQTMCAHLEEDLQGKFISLWTTSTQTAGSLRENNERQTVKLLSTQQLQHLPYAFSASLQNAAASAQPGLLSLLLPLCQRKCTKS
ncbi:hypothetical protein CHARACLAT_022762 [Characodon lateralis]|uniref:Uncharacterized protein n=1 Tax=Characodon lateralis TaxID=208331 RepID=A0ABU7F7B1_9TELE|nr:hypothetical protein [Characodon lateralis]